MESVGPFRALDLVFTLELDDPELAESLGDAFSCMQTKDLPAVHYRVEVMGPHIVTVDGAARAFAARDEVLPWLLWKINDDVLTHTSGLVLHGAAVVIDDVAIVLCGRSGAGKSTLVSALVASGHRYLTDEAVAIGRGGARGWTRPLALGPEARHLLRLGAEDSLAIGLHGERLVAPKALGPTASPGPWELGCVFLLTGQTGAGATSGAKVSLSSAQSIVELASHILTPSRVDGVTIRSLSPLIQRVPVHRMARSSPSQMVERVVELARFPRSDA